MAGLPNIPVALQNLSWTKEFLKSCRQHLGNRSTATFLINRNLPPVLFDDDFYWAVYYACVNGWDEVVEPAIAKLQVHIHVLDPSSNWLRAACTHGHVDIIKMLLRGRVDLSKKSMVNGMTGLEMILDCMEKLKKEKAKIEDNVKRLESELRRSKEEEKSAKSSETLEADENGKATKEEVKELEWEKRKVEQKVLQMENERDGLLAEIKSLQVEVKVNEKHIAEAAEEIKTLKVEKQKLVEQLREVPEKSSAHLSEELREMGIKKRKLEVQNTELDTEVRVLREIVGLKKGNGAISRQEEKNINSSS